MIFRLRRQDFALRRPGTTLRDVRERDLWYFCRRVNGGGMDLVWRTVVRRDGEIIQDRLRHYLRRYAGQIHPPRRSYLCSGWPPRHEQLPTNASTSLIAVGSYSAVYGVTLSGSYRYIAMFSVAVGESLRFGLRDATAASCVTWLMQYHMRGRGVPQ